MGDVTSQKLKRGACPQMDRHERRRLDKLARQLNASGLFDANAYLAANPDVAETGMDPIKHYVRYGRREGRRFAGHFDPVAYLMANPDVASAGIDPIRHYLKFGRFEGRSVDRGQAIAWPEDGIVRERLLGQEFFRAYGFDDVTPLHQRQVDLAVRDLVCSSIQLEIRDIDPVVSIIVPVYGQLPFLLNCLHSLAAQRSRYSAEIIVIDDVSPADSLVKSVQAIPWIRYKPRATNGGFIDSCNEAATMARGKFVVFLNSDVRVADGWLDELIGSFDLFPRAGLVGSRLFNEDGSLQEAGGIYWRDGSAWNYGRGADARQPKYSFARQVDYCSGAAIALPVAVWREMGGFDVGYRPAYCEDADIAFRLRDAGYQVWLQPLSAVLHYEGRTHGRDINSGVKSYQLSNMKKLEVRWRDVLATHRPNGEQPDLEANRFAGERIIVFDALTPTPDQDSGSFITARMLKALKELGFHVIFVPQHGYRYAFNYTKDLQRIGIECVYLPFFSSASAVLETYTDPQYILAYRHNVLDPIYDDIRRLAPKARIIFHNVDLHFVRESREAELLNQPSRHITATASKISELSLIAKSDCTIVHTAVEAKIIRDIIPVSNIIEFPYIADNVPATKTFEERRDIMFLGGFAHTPNIDAVDYFLAEIWPLLMQRLPADARFMIVGAAPPPAIRDHANDRVIVTGFVEDIRPYFEQTRVFVAPLRYGAGIKGKVIQSLAHGVPSVLTPIAAEGIGLRSGVEAVIANDAADFADAVAKLYDDPHSWSILQENGYQFVRANFSWDRCLGLCREILDVADATWIRRQEATFLDPLVAKLRAEAANRNH